MNRKTRILKIVLDVFMSIVLILLMDKMFTGITIHEIIGIAILIVAIIHNILNIKWIKAMTANLFKKDVPIKSKILYIVNFIAFIVMASDVVIGILISEALFPNIQISDRSTLVIWHKFLSYWLLVIISVHIGLHWDMVINGCKNIFKNVKCKWKDSIVVKVLLKIVYVAIALAGIISLAKPEVYNNFILQNNSKSRKNSNSSNVPSTSNGNSSSGSNSSSSSNSGDKSGSSQSSNDDSKQTTSATTISLVTVDEVTSLQDYLGKLYCTGCGHHCPLTNPQCSKGETRQEEETENYNEMYGTDESYSSSSSSSNSSSATTTEKSQPNNSSTMQIPQNSGSNSSTQPNKNDSSMPSAPGNTNSKQMSSNESDETNLMDYVWIMGFIIGGTYYVAKLPKILKKKKEEKEKDFTSPPQNGNI